MQTRTIKTLNAKVAYMEKPVNLFAEQFSVFRSSHRMFSVKKMFLKILQNSQEMIVPESVF